MQVFKIWDGMQFLFETDDPVEAELYRAEFRVEVVEVADEELSPFWTINS